MSRNVLCDSGVLISLTSSCLDRLLYFFAENHDVRFVIPPSVEEESVKGPIERNLKEYLFSAIRIRDAIQDGVVTVVDADVEEEAERFMGMANNVFFARGRPLKLVQSGESEVLALSKKLDLEYIMIDERTTRMLMEAPQRLKEHLEKEFNVNIMVNKNNYQELTSGVSSKKALRSSELVMLAYENGFFKNYGKLEKDALRAALYKIKYSGCSIGFDEIKEYLSRVK
ncbi:hypothetical protein GF318_02725 [Candidatus Micrarchaeota archaeon]|nr:hypothetical protein [Candidatus Micrarchaeota archaeon]